MNTEIAVRPGTAVMSVGDVVSQVQLVQQVMKAVMKQDVHFGVIPGTGKPSLWKPGAEVLCATFRIADSYHVEDLSEPGETARYRVRCVGTHQTSGIVMGEGLGEASSDEEKYKWVKAFNREFDATDPSRKRLKYGWNKAERSEYEIKQVRSNPADVANTILKMAAKRAKIAMVLNVTAASDCFSQDLEDMDERHRQAVAGEGQEAKPTAASPKRKSAPKADPQAEKQAAQQQMGDVPDQNSTQPASEGMIAHLKQRLENAALTTVDALKYLSRDSFDGMTVAEFHKAVDWTRNPAG